MAGKNPVTHVGKLYNIVAQTIAENIVKELDEVQEAHCYLVSRIGHPVTEPQVVDLKIQMQKDMALTGVQSHIKEIAWENLQSIGKLQNRLLEGAIKVY